MNLNTTIMDGGRVKHLKASQLGDANSISGTIVIPNNNCNNSQLSSPDMSEANEIMQRYSSSSINLAAMANGGNDDKDDKHKSSLLKIPGVIKMEQQSVGWIFISNHTVGSFFVVIVLVYCNNVTVCARFSLFAFQCEGKSHTRQFPM